MTTININSLISGLVHRPLSSEKYVLYPKVENYTGDMETKSKAEQSELFKRESSIFFNSPTNIRKLFISGEIVQVQYYGLIAANKKEVRHLETRSFGAKTLKDFCIDNLKFEESMQRFLMSQVIDSKAKKPDKINIGGNGIGIASSPYTCNNLEEIYLDWTMLMSPEVIPYFRELFMDTPLDYIFKAFASGSTEFSVIENNTMANVFTVFNLGGLKDIRKRFPRLKMIGLVSNLGEILKAPGTVNKDILFANPEEAKGTWFDHNLEYIKQSKSVCMISRLKDIPELNKEFMVKDSQYKYDNERLKTIIESYKSKIDDILRKNQYGSAGSEQLVNEQVTHELELMFMEVESNYGEKVLKSVLINAAITSDKKDVLNEFSRFTDKGKKKYGDIIGMQL